MTWAWRQPLPSTMRFVLLALADAADENGACWPSVSTIAERCAVSTRTVQRALRDLIKADLVQSDPRHRGDGSTTSNRYVLRLGGGDTASGAPVMDVTEGCHGCRGGHDMDVTPRTTNRTVIDPSPPPSAAAPEPATSGGDLRKLIFPSKFAAAECVEAAHRLNRFPTPLAQQILDELNGRMQRGEIKTTALAYLGGLISRARAGTFVPNVERRSERGTQQVPRTRQDTDRIAVETSRESAPAYPDVMTNPLCQRVAEIQNRAEQRRSSCTDAVLEIESAPRSEPPAGLVSPPMDIESAHMPVKNAGAFAADEICRHGSDLRFRPIRIS